MKKEIQKELSKKTNIKAAIITGSCTCKSCSLPSSRGSSSGFWKTTKSTKEIFWMAVLASIMLFFPLFFIIQGPMSKTAQAKTSKDPVKISIIAGGDVMFGRLRGEKLEHFGYNQPFRHVRHLFKGHDIVTMNLETPITSKVHYKRKSSSLLFRAKPKAAEIIKDAGFNLVITANNHSHDQLDIGINETIDYLRKQGLPWAGTGRTKEESWKPYIFEKHGVKVGILALTRLNNYTFPGQKGHYAHLIRQRVRKDLPPKVKALSEKVDFTVVVLHWGVEYKHETIARERRLISLLEKAGCDLFIGHHPHVLRGIQKLNGMVAFYSLGNFLFDSVHGVRAEAGLAHAVFEKKGNKKRLAEAEFIPLILAGGSKFPRPATGARATQINKKVIRYSRVFRKTTKFQTSGDKLQVVLP